MKQTGPIISFKATKEFNIKVGSYEHKRYGFMDAKYHANFLVDEKLGRKQLSSMKLQRALFLNAYSNSAK
jgi:hypothetical protein